MAFESMEDKHVPPTFQQATASAMPQFVKNFQAYDVGNPHPGYGTDPNILNCYGHTKYPMWVTKPNQEQVIVNNEEEENAALGKEPVALRDDGPTVEEYASAGYKAANYPPKGYDSRSSEEEIKAAVEKQTPKSGW